MTRTQRPVIRLNNAATKEETSGTNDLNGLLVSACGHDKNEEMQKQEG